MCPPCNPPIHNPLCYCMLAWTYICIFSCDQQLYNMSLYVCVLMRACLHVRVCVCVCVCVCVYVYVCMAACQYVSVLVLLFECKCRSVRYIFSKILLSSFRIITGCMGLGNILKFLTLNILFFCLLLSVLVSSIAPQGHRQT